MWESLMTIKKKKFGEKKNCGKELAINVNKLITNGNNQVVG